LEVDREEGAAVPFVHPWIFVRLSAFSRAGRGLEIAKEERG
jgi:hypothetical protein